MAKRDELVLLGAEELKFLSVCVLTRTSGPSERRVFELPVPVEFCVTFFFVANLVPGLHDEGGEGWGRCVGEGGGGAHFQTIFQSLVIDLD